MSQDLLIVVSENPETIEKAKKYWEQHNVVIHAFSPTQWKEGIDNALFRQEVGLGNSLSSYSSDSHSNVVPFPGLKSQKVPTMEEMESKAISEAIQQYKGNLTEAAKALGIGRATLYRKVKQYNLDPSQARRRKVAA